MGRGTHGIGWTLPCEVRSVVADIEESFRTDAAAVGLVVVPVVFGEGVMADYSIRIFEERFNADALHFLCDLGIGQLQNGGSEVYSANETGAG